MRIRNKWMATTAMAALLAVSVAGCGGGSGDKNNSEVPFATSITRASDPTFSESAKILAARDAAASGATWVSADAATQYDADLGTIRTAYPQVVDIQALPAYDLHTIVVTVKSSASWVSNWQSGSQTTGEYALDSLLAEFAPEKIEAIGTPSGDTAYFKLTFGQSLNMVHLAEQLQGASDNVKSAEPNYTVGDGNNIRETAGGDGTREYSFVQGSGDCPSGCINKHQWSFSVSADGKTATLTGETNTPLAK